MMATLSRNELGKLLMRISFVSVVTYFSVKWMINQIDPTSKNKKKAMDKAESLLKRLGIQHKKVNLSEYELMIAANLVIPEDITVSWNDIAGLESVVQEIQESVVLPVKYRSLLQDSQLYQAPKGVLLHGPPGCGKTLIAKATAKEAEMRFLNLDVAMLTDKWYGESQKLASAVFTLAAKIQPCIIFIDEIDSFLRSRNSNDHEATAQIKTQFMMQWDGLSTQTDSTVIVMGATNRPGDLDKAILRRMPAQIHIGLPKEEQRQQILKLVLENESVASDVNYGQLAKITDKFSGSDLRELCRYASVNRVSTYFRENYKNWSDHNEKSINDTTDLPQIQMQDLMSSLHKMKISKLHSHSSLD